MNRGGLALSLHPRDPMLQPGSPCRPWGRWWSLPHSAAGEKVVGYGVVKPPWGQTGPYSCPKDKLSLVI